MNLHERVRFLLQSLDRVFVGIVDAQDVGVVEDAASHRLQAGDAFVAWPGAAQDGRRYVGNALMVSLLMGTVSIVVMGVLLVCAVSGGSCGG